MKSQASIDYKNAQCVSIPNIYEDDLIDYALILKEIKAGPFLAFTSGTVSDRVMNDEPGTIHKLGILASHTCTV